MQSTSRLCRMNAILYALLVARPSTDSDSLPYR